MKEKICSGCKIIDKDNFEYVIVDCDKGFQLVCITTGYTNGQECKDVDEILDLFKDGNIKILDDEGNIIMGDKYICNGCGEDLREVGIYRKVYDNYAYVEETGKFELSSSDDAEGYLCGCCDGYVDM